MDANFSTIGKVKLTQSRHGLEEAGFLIFQTRSCVMGQGRAQSSS